ncbi:MAG: type I-E CRISPR-associated protein Cas7/Cse4/CasC [Eubacteriales bacterium]|nr:type I-E CRISPR-associated protein Cas7/Cse4/CasC [Eubacteriales bacterium]
MNNYYLDLHVLQTVPPSCINRDDTGSPKTAVYGGVTRARVSSQAWKHAMRKMFTQIFSEEQMGVRTKSPVNLIVKELEQLGYEGKVEKAAAEALKKGGIKLNSKDNKSDALFFMSRMQARKLAELIVAKEEDAKVYKAALADFPAIDIALFGRMVASDPSLNFDAAAQVAHSISTHEVRNEYDYFTAVDDLAPEDNAGAGHLGTVEFHSATLYRYATVNLRELKELLEADTAEAVKGFVKAFLLSMPTGKQNTFANRTAPDFAYITFRKDQPVNLAGAFEKPIFTRKDGYAKKSVQALEEYAKKTYEAFVDGPQEEYCIGAKGEHSENRVSLGGFLEILEKRICEYCEEE